MVVSIGISTFGPSPNPPRPPRPRAYSPVLKSMEGEVLHGSTHRHALQFHFGRKVHRFLVTPDTIALYIPNQSGFVRRVDVGVRQLPMYMEIVGKGEVLVIQNYFLSEGPASEHCCDGVEWLPMVLPLRSHPTNTPVTPAATARSVNILRLVIWCTRRINWKAFSVVILLNFERSFVQVKLPSVPCKRTSLEQSSPRMSPLSARAHRRKDGVRKNIPRCHNMHQGVDWLLWLVRMGFNRR